MPIAMADGLLPPSMMTVPPCLAFVLFAADRKNFPAVLFATGFAVCHLVFAIVNFVK